VIANASLIVITSTDVIFGLVASRFAGYLTIPSLRPITWDVASTTEGEGASLICAAKIALSWHVEEFEPLRIILASACSFVNIAATLDTTIDHVDCCAETTSEVGCQVCRVWFVEASYHIMHARFRVLGAHVEPNACSESQEAVFMDKLGVLEQVKSAIIATRCKDV